MFVLHRGEVVGELTEEMPDMWYLEGQFVPSVTPAGAQFAMRAQALVPRTALENPTQAIRTRLVETTDDPGVLFVVMSLAEGRLFGRRVFEKRAVEWAERNVPE